MKIRYSQRARKQILKLPRHIQTRIVRKIGWYASQHDPLSFAKHLTDTAYGNYRFRIGDYRVICDVKGKSIRILVILSIKHRNKVYENI